MAKILILGDLKVGAQPVRAGQQLQKLCTRMDLVAANVEGPIVANPKPRSDKQGVCLSNSASISSLCNDLCIKLFFFGNNHIYDHGDYGLTESRGFCDTIGISWIGASDSDGIGQSLYKNDLLKVCIYSFAHREGPVCDVDVSGFGPCALPDTGDLECKIRNFISNGYKVVVVYHGGEEYFNYPWPRRLGWFKRMSDAGASIVIGTHSHSIQPVYVTESVRYLAPGLGNTYFDDPCQKGNKLAAVSIALEYDTTDGSMVVHRLRADFAQGQLEILESTANIEQWSSGLEELWRNWPIDARLYILGLLNRLPKQSDSLWKRSLRPSYITFSFLMRLFHRTTRNKRDIDILLGALFFDSGRRLKQIFAEGYSNFRF